MKAAVVREKGGPFVIEQVELDAPRADEVLVKLVASGVCHTDMVYRDRVVEPSVFGHEGAGVVQEVGSSVHGIAPGDKVLLSFTSCGRCRACLSGRPAYCARFYPLNMSGEREDGSVSMHDHSGAPVRGTFLAQSSFGEYALATERNTIRVDPDTPLDTLALLSPLGCGIQTGAGAVLNSLGVETGASVMVFGAGAVGLSAVLGAVIAGATRIIVSDVVPERLDLARRLGATDTILATESGLVDTVRSWTDGGVDYAVESSGNMGAARNAVDVLTSTGTAAMVGVGRPGAELALDHASLRAGKRVIGVIEGDAVPQEFIPALIALHRQGRLPFDEFVKTYPFADIEQAVRDSESGETVKGVLLFD